MSTGDWSVDKTYTADGHSFWLSATRFALARFLVGAMARGR